MSERPLAGLERHKHNLLQFIRSGTVGGSGALVTMFAALIMTRAHGGTARADDTLFAVGNWDFSFSILVWIVGFLVANLYNFQLNRSWTFKSSKHARWWKEFWPFLAVGSVAALAGMFFKVALKDPASPVYLPEPYFHEARGLQSREYWSQLIAIVLTMPINFVVNKLWTFRAVRHHRRGQIDVPMVAPVMDSDEVDDHGDVIADTAVPSEPARRPGAGAAE